MLKAISLFTGVGGLDFGFEEAGFETRVAVELDATCCATLRLNRKWPVIQGDIHNVSSSEILSAAGLSAGEADVLIGGPPCQPFSKNGYWAKGDSLRLDDPRAGTLGAYLRVLKDTRPKVFLLENVSGLAFKGKDEGLNHILEGVEKVNTEAGTNYKVTYKVLSAADYGVPQFRDRVFLVGQREGELFKFPDPTHGTGGDDASPKLLPYSTVWDAIGDLTSPSHDDALQLKGKWADLLPSIPEGQNYLHHTRRGGGVELFGWRTRYWSFLLKLAKSAPSWTIQASPGPAIGPFHWKNRRLSPAELCRIQTFPDGLVFKCGIGHVQRMLGNAVPSLLAEVLAREICRQFFHRTDLSEKPNLLPQKRADLPPPEPVVAVPNKYLQLVGSYDEHPGEGKGPASVKRLVQGSASNTRAGASSSPEKVPTLQMPSGDSKIKRRTTKGVEPKA